MLKCNNFLLPLRPQIMHRRWPVHTRSQDQFVWIIRLESVLLIGAIFEIGPSHVTPWVRPMFTNDIFYLEKT